MARPLGIPVPDPPNAWDIDIIEEGPDRMEIAQLLEETTEIAVVDWKWQRLFRRRMVIWLRLRELGVTHSRMARAYAVNGRSVITATAITLAFRRHDERLKGRAYNKNMATDDVACWCGAKQIQVPRKAAQNGEQRSCGERTCHPPLAQEESE